MEPWYYVAKPRKEVREGRSFDPAEFAIALEQVVAGTAPEDYSKAVQFFKRTCFTRALTEHSSMVLRRLAGKTENTAPVLTLITQFGGGKTHTLTALYHMVKNGKKLASDERVQTLIRDAGLSGIPKAKVAVFVGNAWDPSDGCETPWLDIARQLAGDAGASALGKAAKAKAPGTNALSKLFQASGGSVLILFDEVLNFMNRHADMANGFHAFIQNLTVAMTGTTHGAAIISLPRSTIEMTDPDTVWQERITKVVKRVAKDLISNDEAEISEVVRRRLFKDLGDERIRKKVSRKYADWCFERRAQLPPEWTAVDTARTEAKSREFLRERFETCYPFHPATLSVFQRKWQSLKQYQRTRGTLAMLAQWISTAYQEDHKHARREPLITLGSAPLDIPGFRGIILGQLGEDRLGAAIEADIAGTHSHARALDVDTKGPLRDIHRRVASTILFESSGGHSDRLAHLPELRFALGGPQIDTTSIDNAAMAMEKKGFYLRKAGTDGYKFGFKPTLKKVVGDRRASLDEADIKKSARYFIKKEFESGAGIPLVLFPQDSSAVQDTPRLTLAVMDPETEWDESKETREKIAEWAKKKGESQRSYPAALIWCLRKSARDLYEKVETMLAWKRVQRDISDGTLGDDFERSDKAEVRSKISDAEVAVQDEIWAGYRFIAVADRDEKNGLRVIDLGAGHASSAESMRDRILTALKAEGLLNESIGVGYLERNWPEAHKESGAWPLSGLRQSFLDGSLTRLPDPDKILRQKIIEFVEKGSFGLASGKQSDGTYASVWFNEMLPTEEVDFASDVYLLTKKRAKKPEEPTTEKEKRQDEDGPGTGEIFDDLDLKPTGAPQSRTLTIRGSIPPELWNRLGTKLIPKLKQGEKLQLGLELSTSLDAKLADALEKDIKQILSDLKLEGKLNTDLK